MHIEDDEILQGFIEESLEHLADIENDLLSIEEAAANVDEDLVNKVFRAAHSIKGGAGFMGLTTIQELSHAMENVLGMIRSKTLVPTPEIVNVLLLASDQLQQMIEDVQNSNDVDIQSHLSPLNAIANHEFAQPADQPAVQKSPAETTPPVDSDATPASPAPVDQMAEHVVVEEAEAVGQAGAFREPEEEVMDDPEEHIDAPPPGVDDVEPAEMAVEAASARDNGNARGKVETSIRVHVSLLDQLMTLAGELVLSRNQLLQTIGGDDFRNMEGVGQRIDLITSELQEAIMLTRMQPIGNVFNKFPRVVRDLSKKLGKKIDLTIIGKDVELDKTIIEAINDPLTHLVRNSVDHGVEIPQERKKAGKSEVGVVQLKAFHEAGQVVIEIADDGHGIDGDALAASAVNKGLLTLEQTQAMSEKEKVNLIFLPGFSTAKEVTDVSGRGVGMDVVKKNIEKLRGKIDLKSVEGQGSTFILRIPLTLAIIDAINFTVGPQLYSLPITDILQFHKAKKEEITQTETDRQVINLRGEVIPIVKLHEFFEVGEAPEVDEGIVIVAQARDKKIAVLVDEILGYRQVVIKALPSFMDNIRALSGCSIMADGKVSLIIDTGSLIGFVLE